MSIQVMNIWQIILMFFFYTFLTLLLPCFVLWNHLNQFKNLEKLLICYTAGIFYLVNLVYFLEIFKVSNKVTLIAGIIIPIIWEARNRRVAEKVSKKISQLSSNLKKLDAGTFGNRHFADQTFHHFLKLLIFPFIKLFWIVRKYPVDCIFFSVMTVFIMIEFGGMTRYMLGYGASDIIVHSYWINQMKYNNIFAAGVYPFGMHNLVYLMHELTGFKIMTLMRLFYVVSDAYTMYALFAFMYLLFRNKYLSYGVTTANIITASFYNINVNADRFYATLPQEYGMMFIYPSLYYLIAFVVSRTAEIGKKEIEPKTWKMLFHVPGFLKKKDKKPEVSIKIKIRNLLEKQKASVRQSRKSQILLLMFILSFSLTVSFHFYNTIVVFLICVGFAIGFIHLIFRREYFVPILRSALLAIVIAFIPLTTAVAMGKHLEGSMYWAVNIMKGKDKSNLTDIEIPEGKNATYYFDANGNLIDVKVEDNDDENTDNESDEEIKEEEKKPSFKETILVKLNAVKEKITTAYPVMVDFFQQKLLPLREKTIRVILWLPLCIFSSGLLRILIRKLRHHKRSIYNDIIISMSFSTEIMILATCAAGLKLPTVMPFDRADSFLNYLLPAAGGFMLDSLLLPGRFKKRIRQAGSVLLAAVLVIASLNNAKTQWQTTDRVGMQVNESIIVLTNVMRNFKNNTWTIVSANDERQMVDGYGYHTEIIDLLHGIEKPSASTTFYIPTPDIFVYIETTPLIYDGRGYQDPFTEKDADKQIPSGSGLSVYKYDNRKIVMARLYYWAQTLQKMHPDEVSVYYKTDKFICYRIHQNTYRLLNLAIDYGYNTKDYDNAKENK